MNQNSQQKVKMRAKLERFAASTLQAERKKLLFRAVDSRKEIQRSLKSGGKNRFSKTFRTSKPGDPPLTHGAKLKRSIRYQIESPDKIKVGAPSIAGSRTAKTLEQGGVSTMTDTRLNDSNFARRKKNASAAARERRRALKAGVAVQKEKPAAKRAYYVRGENGTVRRVKNYEYFNSTESARRGMESTGFKSWRQSVQKTTTVKINVAARPFVKPAVKRIANK